MSHSSIPAVPQEGPVRPLHSGKAPFDKESARTTYVLVRTDLPLAQQAVQAIHAAMSATARFGGLADDTRLALLSVGSEGELPFAAPAGRVVHYTDMTGPFAGFAGLEESDDGRRLYIGENVTFDDLTFANLRPVEGWTLPRPGGRLAGDPQFSPAP